MCSKLITFFVCCLCLSLCVLPCSAEDATSSTLDSEFDTLLDQAEENDLDLVVPYASGSSFSITPGRQYSSIQFVDSQNNSVTLKNLPVSSYTWNASTGTVTNAVSSIDFNALASSDSAWTSTLITQLMAKIDVLNSYLGTATSNSALSHLTSIDSRLYQDGGSIAYWTRQIHLLTAQMQGYMQAGIPSLDGHLFDTSGYYNAYYLDGGQVKPFQVKGSNLPQMLSNISGSVADFAGYFYRFRIAYDADVLSFKTSISQFSQWLSGSDNFQLSFSLDLITDYDEDGNPVTTTTEYASLAEFLGGLGTSLENPLKMLQDVLATPEDIRLREQEAENKKEFTDNFIGEGDAAASKDDISDAAGFTSGIKDAFGGNTVSAGDVFKPMTDEDTFAFFSQSTHDALDTTGGTSVVSDSYDDEFWEQFEVDENGFYHVKDQSAWSILDYLRKED